MSIWQRLYEAEKDYANWYRKYVNNKYQSSLELVTLNRESTGFFLSILLGSCFLANPKLADELKNKDIVKKQTSGSSISFYIEMRVKAKEAVKELGTFSYATIRRYLEAYCNIKSLAQKKRPIQTVPPKIPAQWKRDFICQTQEGLFIWFPYVDRQDWAEEVENEYWSMPEGERKWKHSYTIIYSSPLHQLLVYYSGDRRPNRLIKVVPGCSVALSLETILALFEDPPLDRLGNIISKVGLSIYPSEFLKKEEYTRAVLAAANEILNNHTASPYDVLVAKGTALVVLEWQKKLDELKRKVKELREKAREAANTTKGVPPLPHFSKEFKLFPHQAAVLGSLLYQPSAIVGVEMGGGKTLISCYDALVKLAQGHVRRPCIVMPNNLLYQFKNEVTKFTAGSVNVIIVNTQTTKKYGLDKLKDLIRKAPSNTLVLCSYEWISNGALVYPNGNHVISVYDRAAWLIGECGVDMITLDEAHFIKNATSNRSSAALLLSHAKVKRAMSGTIIPNKLVDLVGPVSFVKPHVFRGLDNFEKEFVIRGRYGIRGYRPDAPDIIKSKLEKENALFYSRSAWIYLLPKRKIRVHRVDLPEQLRIEYNRILKDTFDEINKLASENPKVREALENGDISTYPYILQKLTALDRFLTHPASVSEVVKSFPPELQVSPKVKVINRILNEHFANSDSKVIILVKFKESARHILENIYYRDKALYFDGEHQQNLIKFKNNPNYKILVAVDKALKHGWNITEATRVIKADLNYSWGDEDQLFGRIFRPGQKNEVIMDILLAHGTLEVTKFLNMVTKHTVNTYVTSDWSKEFKLEERFLHLIPMNVENITLHSSFEEAKDYANLLDRMLEFERQEGERKYAKKYGKDYIDPKRAKPLSLEKIPVPAIPNLEQNDWYIGQKKPKFNFSLVKGTAEVPKTPLGVVIAGEEAEDLTLEDVWFEAEVKKDLKKAGLYSGQKIFLKKAADGTFTALRRTDGKLVTLSPWAVRNALVLLGPVKDETAMKIKKIVKKARKSGKMKAKVWHLGFDSNRQIWLKIPGRGQAPGIGKSIYMKYGMRRVGKGWKTLQSVLNLLKRRGFLDSSTFQEFKVVLERLGGLVRGAVLGKDVPIMIFIRHDLKNGWEILVPAKAMELLELSFLPALNYTLIAVNNYANLPKKARQIARIVRTALIDEHGRPLVTKKIIEKELGKGSKKVKLKLKKRS